MKLRFEGSLEEFQAVFGHAEATWAAEIEITDPDKAVAEIEAEAEAYLSGAKTPVVPFPTEVQEAPKTPAEAESAANRLAHQAATAVENLPEISPLLRQETWAVFKSFCAGWAQGFEQDTEERAELERKRPYEGKRAEAEVASAEKKAEKKGEQSNYNPFDTMRTVEEEARWKELADKQPDRVQLMRDLSGQSRYIRPLLIMAYEVGSLQHLVEKALVEECGESPGAAERTSDWLDYIERLTGLMIMVSHKGFPDLAGTYDHSTKWRRVQPAQETAS